MYGLRSVGIVPMTAAENVMMHVHTINSLICGLTVEYPRCDMTCGNIENSHTHTHTSARTLCSPSKWLRTSLCASFRNEDVVEYNSRLSVNLFRLCQSRLHRINAKVERVQHWAHWSRSSDAGAFGWALWRSENFSCEKWLPSPSSPSPPSSFCWIDCNCHTSIFYRYLPVIPCQSCSLLCSLCTHTPTSALSLCLSRSLVGKFSISKLYICGCSRRARENEKNERSKTTQR